MLSASWELAFGSEVLRLWISLPVLFTGLDYILQIIWIINRLSTPQFVCNYAHSYYVLHFFSFYSFFMKLWVYQTLLGVVLQLLVTKLKGCGMDPPWLTLIYYRPSRFHLQELSRTAKIYRMSGAPIEWRPGLLSTTSQKYSTVSPVLDIRSCDFLN
jgi:hypothetical protein